MAKAKKRTERVENVEQAEKTEKQQIAEERKEIAQKPSVEGLTKQVASTQAENAQLKKENEALAAKVAREQERRESVYNLTNVEREIRRYVKRAGGYRKGLAHEAKAECAKLLQIRNRLREKEGLEKLEGIVWNFEIETVGTNRSTVGSFVIDKKTGQMVDTRAK
jgi:predicted RNase H-like nuclease (RuvC/YqgF family)